ncbi:MAG: phage tail sheath C-terminal domain-containing protein [Chloroflexota bacterium]
MPAYLSPGVYVEEKPSAVQTIASAGTSTPGFIGIIPDTILIPVKNDKYDPAKAYVLPDDPASIEAAPPPDPDAEEEADDSGGSDDSNLPYKLQEFTLIAKNADVIFCANIGDFVSFFGNFSLNEEHRKLAHAVYGFFMNGGSSCFVTRIVGENDLDLALKRFEAVDEIAIVAAPGVASSNVWDKINSHCAKMNDRFAILDMVEEPVLDTLGGLQPAELESGKNPEIVPSNNKNAAVYLPYLQVVDPALVTVDPLNQLGQGNGSRSQAGRIYVPPSGHMAGVYARTDIERGVFKAPANTDVRGALGLKFNITKAEQDILNPKGINCIRRLNGSIKSWGGRTMGGDSNGEWRYINVRRTFINIMEDIEKGTQWVVFEPNTPELWDKIVMNVSAYLTGRWREGALFGTSPEASFFVKCDFETNPPDARELGQVRTVIGVAIVRPAEFVIFEISQMAQQAG